MAEAFARVRFALASVQEGADGRPVIVRVTLTGATALHAALVADPEAADAECRAAAASVSGDLHVERVRIETAPPAAAGQGAEDIAALAGPFMAALDDAEVAARLLEEFRDLARQFPRQAGRAAPAVPQSAEDLRALAPDAWQAVAHALAGGAP
jgi:hypothetical protein